MLEESSRLKEIIKYISFWISRIKLENSINFYDINKDSEGLCLQLLNLVYNYNLLDLNEKKTNYPGIDLGDKDQGVAFQVTSRRDLKKIKHTLSTFYTQSLDEQFFKGVQVVILSNEKVNRKGIIKDFPQFDFRYGIIYPEDIIKEIQLIYRKDYARFLLVEELLKNKLSLNLYPVSSGSLINFDTPQEHMEFYADLFRSRLKSNVDRFIDLNIYYNSAEISVQDFFSDFSAGNYIVSGSSGCGKSTFAKVCAYNSTYNRIAPLILEAKYYQAGLSNLIDKEVSNFGFPTGKNFFDLSKLADFKIFLIIDGLNECTAEAANALLVELQELSKKYNAIYMITLQEIDSVTFIDKSNRILIGEPSLFEKYKIATQFTKHIKDFEAVISVVNTRLEAAILGQIAQKGLEKISRLDLFYLYLGKKLNQRKTEAFTFLSEIANVMVNEVWFSLPLRNIDMMVQDLRISEDIVEYCLASSIIIRNQTSLSFSHEMFLNFFSAINISSSGKDDKAIIEAFFKPRNYNNRLFIISSLDEMRQDVLLDKINDNKLFTALFNGEAGGPLMDWAHKKLTEVLKKVEREIYGITYDISREFLYHVRIVPETIFNWTEQETAILIAFTEGINTDFCEKILYFSDLLDTKNELEFKRLLDSAREKSIGLRSGIFRTVYVSGMLTSNVSPGISKIFSHLSPRFYNQDKFLMEDECILKHLDTSISPGQLYFLLKLYQYTEKQSLFYEIVLRSLKENWRFLPYNLKLELLEMAGHCYTTELERLDLIEAIGPLHENEQNAFLSTAFFDALRALGQFDDVDDYIGQVYKELDDVLELDEDEYGFQAAASFISRQYDHPYCLTYYQVISGLDTFFAKKLYARAVQFTTDSFQTSFLLVQAELVLGYVICPLILGHVKSPFRDSVMPFESLSAFVTVYLIFAKHKFSLEHLVSKDLNPPSAAVRAFSEMLYWLDRDDLTLEQAVKNCTYAQKIFFEEFPSYILSVLIEIQKSIRDFIRNSDHSVFTKFLTVFNGEILDASRVAISCPQSVQGVVEHFTCTKDLVISAINYLKHGGHRADVHILKKIVDHPEYGFHAMEAVKLLQRQ